MIRCVLIILALLLGLSAARAEAQPIQRSFPAKALRGELVVVQSPDITMNGQPARLAPGARIRGINNLLQMSAALTGQPLVVHYTVDPYGLVHEVWILSDDERTRTPWPTTPADAARWLFDPVGQTWIRR
ncbi:MAG: hypothetical protein ACKVQR_08925 [Aquabacterium sp.]